MTPIPVKSSTKVRIFCHCLKELKQRKNIYCTDVLIIKSLVISLEAFGALWMLSFDEENQKIMINDDAVMEAFIKFRTSHNIKVKKACNGALWNMREELRTIKKYRGLGNQTIFKIANSVKLCLFTVLDKSNKINLTNNYLMIL